MSVAALPAALFPQQGAPLRGNDSQRLDSSSRRAASGKGVDDVDAPEDEREPKDDAANASPDAFNELLAGLLNVSSPQPVESPPVQEAAAETPAAASVDAVSEAPAGAATNAASTGAAAVNGTDSQASATDSTSSVTATPAETQTSATGDNSAPQPGKVTDAPMNSGTAEANSSASVTQATTLDATPQAGENQSAPETSADVSVSEEPRTESSSARDTLHPSSKPVAAATAPVEPMTQAPSTGSATEAGKIQKATEAITPAEKKAAPEKPAEVAHSTHELNTIEPVVQDVGASAISAAANPCAPRWRRFIDSDRL